MAELFRPLPDLAASIVDGARVCLPKIYPFALLREIVRQGRRDLDIVGIVGKRGLIKLCRLTQIVLPRRDMGRQIRSVGRVLPLRRRVSAQKQKTPPVRRGFL